MFNPYVTVPIIVWAVAQFTKFVLASARGSLDFRNLYASGGMPSVHSAVVIALVTTAYLIDGPDSAYFGITAVLAGIVIYDSLGVRRSNGEQAKALNVVIESLQANKVSLAQPLGRLREVLGHKPAEVAVGGVMGLALGMLLNPDRLGGLTAILTRPIGSRTVTALTVAAALLLVGGWLVRFVYLRRYSGVGPMQKVIKRSYLIAASIGVVGLLLAFLAWQRVPAALWVVWPGLLVLAGCATLVMRIVIYKDQIPAWLEQHREHGDKARWLEGPNKKRRAAKARSRKRR